MKLQLSRVALGSAVTLSLVGGSLLTASDATAQCGAGVDKKGEPIAAPAAVMITGGTITNETVIDISANAGTSISDASGGNNNLATTGGGGGERRLDTASSGNGGVATSSANGGAVSIQDINSGGNAGNAISVGDTTCAPFTPPAPEKPKDSSEGAAPGEGRGGTAGYRRRYRRSLGALRADHLGWRRGRIPRAAPPLIESPAPARPRVGRGSDSGPESDEPTR